MSTAFTKEFSTPAFLEGRQLWRGTFSKDVLSLRDKPYVILPEWHKSLMVGPCFLQSRSDVGIPKIGDSCIVIFDNRRQPWIVAWWPEIARHWNEIVVFTHGWVNADSVVDETAGWIIRSDGRIELKGLIKDGTIGQSAFQLPLTARPAKTQHFSSNAGNAAGGGYIDNAGFVVPNYGSNAYFSLMNIVFDPA